MIRIEKQDWRPSTFAKDKSLADILREPSGQYNLLSSAEKDKIRQSQVMPEEVIRILGFYDDFALISKWDHVLGWLPQNAFQVEPEIQNLSAPFSKTQMSSL